MRNIIRRYVGDLLALLAIATIVGIFFLRLFWPEPQIIVTPDFGRSDAWHFSFATKLVLAENLKRGQLPLWEPRMGMGFPLFAEGQVGALFLPNLILMSLPGLTALNPVTAYNATYVILFLILGWGMYAWLRIIGCSRLPSLLGALTITFSGQTIPRLPHHTLLEALALTPLVLGLTHLVLTKNNFLWISLFALALSQQLFTGSPQPVFLTLITVGLYVIVMLWKKPRRFLFGPLGRFTIGCVLGLGLAAIQLLPSAEMLRESTSPGGFSPDEASFYSFPLVHLKTLIEPFVLGNPKFGTYPPFTTFDGSIFWENNVFVGILPIVLFFLGVIRPPLAMQGEALRKFAFFFVAIGLSLLLMLGKHSPLYLLYSVWPLNLFRVPSRFAWIFLITIVSAASWFLTNFLSQQHTWKKIIMSVVAILIAFQSYQLMMTWWEYHAVKPARLWLTTTPFVENIRKSQTPVRTIGSELVHNKYFLKEGWEGNLDRYQFLTNIPSPNSNLYWDIRQTDTYAGRFLKRPSLVESLLGSEIKSSEVVATISAQGKRLLDLYHSSVIVTAIPPDMEKPFPIMSATASGDLTITAYRNPDSLPRVYLATQIIIAPTLTKAAEALANPSFIPGKTVLVHDEALTISEGDRAGSVEITSDHPTAVTMRADVSAEKAVLVFGDTYYPGWQATIDGQPTKIFPVNIKERGILLQKGNYEVVWKYQPEPFRLGVRISLIALAVTVLLPVVYPVLAGRLRTRS